MKNIDVITHKKMLLDRKKQLQEGLPHLYGFKHYKWSREFFECWDKLIFLSAANQIGKSSVAIRKAIYIATEPSIWPKVSAHTSRGTKPTLIFFLLPTLGQCRRELLHKWPEFLPRNEFKDHPQYGWTKVDNSEKISLIFNTGVEIQFLGYSQGKANISALAGSSPAAVFIDEECPPILFPELSARVRATKGLLAFFATPVIGYRFYKDIFEGRTKLENAWIRTVSAYECTKFEDGSPGVYSYQELKKQEALLGSQAEIDRRLHGKYSASEGLMFESFVREKNVKPAESIPEEWLLFAGIDCGSGGRKNHPAAITFVAVSPDFREGRVVYVWRGSKDEETSNSDIVQKYNDIRFTVFKGKPVTAAYYDWASKDFQLVAQRANVMGLMKADKDRTFGISLLNTLFKNDMLSIDHTEPNQVLVEELENNRVDEKKTKAEDDAIDSCRYAISKIPWDFTHITVDKSAALLIKENKRPTTREEMRAAEMAEAQNMITDMQEEFDAWNAFHED